MVLWSDTNCRKPHGFLLNAIYLILKQLFLGFPDLRGSWTPGILLPWKGCEGITLQKEASPWPGLESILLTGPKR